MRLFRWTFTLLAFISLLCGVVIVLFWSHAQTWSTHGIYVSTGNGKLWIVTFEPPEKCIHFLSADGWKGVRQAGFADGQIPGVVLWDTFEQSGTFGIGHGTSQCIIPIDAAGKVTTAAAWDGDLDSIGGAGAMSQCYEAHIPCGVAASACAPLPLIWLAGVGFGIYGKRRRARKGLCEQCGYDLTGNASGRCPECGKSIRRSD